MHVACIQSIEAVLAKGKQLSVFFFNECFLQSSSQNLFSKTLDTLFLKSRGYRYFINLDNANFFWPELLRFNLIARVMRTTFLIIALIICAPAIHSQTGVKWDNSYSFDKCNSFKIEFYAKNNELMRTDNCLTFYQSNGENILFRSTTQRGNVTETLIDKKYAIGLQMYSIGTPNAYYNAGGYIMPDEESLKKLDLLATTETKQIAGFTCTKYTYTYKKIFGEVWITNEVNISNDFGVFRACKMAAKHNTLSVPGFVMEMTTEDSGGGKTIMTTVSLFNDESYKLDLTGKTISTAINKISYYLFP